MLKLASLAKLNLYADDYKFQRVMNEIGAVQDEGMDNHEVDVAGIDPDVCHDLCRALEDLGYIVSYSDDDHTITMTYE